MHKAILMLLLFVTGTSIAAEGSNWVEIGGKIKKHSGMLGYYADLSSILIDGNRARIWELMDLDRPKDHIIPILDRHANL